MSAKFSNCLWTLLALLDETEMTESEAFVRYELIKKL